MNLMKVVMIFTKLSSAEDGEKLIENIRMFKEFLLLFFRERNIEPSRGGYSGEGSEGALHLILGVKTSIINLMTHNEKKYNNNIVKGT